MISPSESYALSKHLGRLLLAQHWSCTVAESCTGGSLAAAITEIPGSSQWFDRGFITYSRDAKQAMLGVSEEILNRCGVVSEETVRAMAIGALHRSHAACSVAISGIAGPSGGSLSNPVGTVWIAWARGLQQVQATRYLFTGDRRSVRNQSVMMALQGLIDLL